MIPIHIIQSLVMLNRSGPVIEPSEIIINREQSDRSAIHRPNPWLRFIARFFDYSLFFTFLQLVSSPISLPGVGRFVPIEYLAWVPIETLLLATWGTTPGKWLLCIDIQRGYAKRLPFRVAFRRSFLVYFRGIGMGIPIINVLCMLSAFYRTRLLHPTTWDRDAGTLLAQRSFAKWRYYLAALVVVAGMIFYSFWNKSWI